MPWNGSAPNQTYLRSDGTRTGAAVNVTAKANGVNDTAALADNRENDFATALSLCLKIDGGTQPSANLPMNDKKFTGLAAGTAANDSVRLVQIQTGGLIYAEASGTANAIELTTTPTFTPAEGTMIVFIAEADNSGATTVNVNATSALALQFGGAACSGGEVNNGQAHIIVNDGTQWQLANPARLYDLLALAKTDGNIIVGDGTNWVAESGATARTSLGLGTGDSPQFTAVNIGAASDTTITRTGAGDIAVEGNGIYRAGGTDVAIADGGTGASTAAAAFAALKQAATDSATGVVEKATQAEIEAETADKYPDAALIKFNPGVAKCWAVVTVSGGTPTLDTSYNITGITDTGIGQLTVTIATDFSSANWAAAVSVVNSAGLLLGNVTSKAAGSILIRCDNLSGVSNDPEAYSMIGMGDR